MSNRRLPSGGHRNDFNRNSRNTAPDRSAVSPWQNAGLNTGMPNLLPLAANSTEATLALASNLINLLQQPRQNTVPSLLDMPIRRDFGSELGRYDQGFSGGRMSNQGHFRRTGNRTGDRSNFNRKPYSRPNEGQRHQNKSTSKKDFDSKADSKTNLPKESDEKEKSNEKKNEDKIENKGDKKMDDNKEHSKSRYDEIRSDFLKCHICNKSMWDGRSFENHINGRAHAIMMQKTAESYALTADTMRQELKIQEMKRSRKSGQPTPRDFYCAMCEMYAADGAAHRTSMGHRRLKKYLHPGCTWCHKEMPTRIELDVHRLTLEHMKNFQDKQEFSSKTKATVLSIWNIHTEENYIREEKERENMRKLKREGNSSHTDTEVKGENEVQASENQEEKKDPEVAQEDGEDKKYGVDNESTILDYKDGDDLSQVTNDNFPVYSTERGVGKSFLAEFRCIECKLCNKFMDNEETAEVHLRTWKHHQQFCKLLAEKTYVNAKQEEDTKPKTDISEDTEGQELDELLKNTSDELLDDTCLEDTNKRSHNSEESGNWKRRKASQDTEEQDDDADLNGLDGEDKSNNDATEPQGVNIKEEMDYNKESDDWNAPEDKPSEEEDIKHETNDEVVKDEEKTAPVVEAKVEQVEEMETQDVKESAKVNTPKVSGDTVTRATRAVAVRGTPRGRARGRGRGRQ